jgi:hypothetical protein
MIEKLHSNKVFHICLFDKECWYDNKEYGKPMRFYLHWPIHKTFRVWPETRYEREIWGEPVRIVSSKEEYDSQQRDSLSSD